MTTRLPHRMERLICTYESVVAGGAAAGSIPRRYSKGIADGRSRITVAPC